MPTVAAKGRGEVDERSALLDTALERRERDPMSDRRASNASGVRRTRNSFCNFHIMIRGEKANGLNLIRRAADSRIGGAILLYSN